MNTHTVQPSGYDATHQDNQEVDGSLWYLLELGENRRSCFSGHIKLLPKLSNTHIECAIHTAPSESWMPFDRQENIASFPPSVQSLVVLHARDSASRTESSTIANSVENALIQKSGLCEAACGCHPRDSNAGTSEKMARESGGENFGPGRAESGAVRAAATTPTTTKAK